MKDAAVSDIAQKLIAKNVSVVIVGKAYALPQHCEYSRSLQ